jgi:hypothetical protein
MQIPSIRTVFINPAIPDAIPVCPILDFTDPTTISEYIEECESNSI